MKQKNNQQQEKMAESIQYEQTMVFYVKPRLVCYGDVRDVTLGGSPGGGDSGSPTVERRRR